jgi:hypothetical protein
MEKRTEREKGTGGKDIFACPGFLRNKFSRLGTPFNFTNTVAICFHSVRARSGFAPDGCDIMTPGYFYLKRHRGLYPFFKKKLNFLIFYTIIIWLLKFLYDWLGLRGF